MAPDLATNRWATGPWCWHADRAVRLATPVPCRGALSLWWLTEDQARLFDPALRVRRALTVLQPYTSALVAGVKDIENRTWRPYLAPDEEWVAVHASKAPYPNAVEVLEDWRHDGDWPDAPPLRSMPLGSIVGAVHLAGFYRFDPPEDE